MSESIEDKRPVLFLFTPGKDFVRPYFEAIMDEYRISDSTEDARCAVMISSADIYDVKSGRNYNELTEIDETCEQARLERAFTEQCRESMLRPVILRCADIVCTGMAGFPRRLAERIYRGTYAGISDNEAVRSVVHGTSLPDAARVALEKSCNFCGEDYGESIFNVTDGTETEVNALADAIAWRMSQKRVFFIKPKWYRWIFGRRNMEEQTRSLTFSSEKLRGGGLYAPVRVIDYLKTHNYNENSL